MKESVYLDDTGVELYDIAFDWKRNVEADFLEKCINAYGNGNKGILLDVACGTGTFLQEVVARGWQAAGFDCSIRMIDLAKKRVGGSIELIIADMSNFKIKGPFDAATCWLDSFTYLLTNKDIIHHLRSVSAVLKPNGLYLLDFGFDSWAQTWWDNPDTNWEPRFEEGWSSARGDIEVYHDGSEGPPCDCNGHLFTEYMYFRTTHKKSGEVREHRYKSPKRSFHPQEFLALLSASSVFDVVEIFTDKFDLDSKLDRADGKGRALVLLKKKS